MTRFNQFYPGLVSEAEPCFMCTVRAAAHTMDDMMYALSGDDQRRAMRKAVYSLYELYDLLDEDVDISQTQDRWQTHIRHRLHRCEHFPEDVDNPVDGRPF